MDLGISRILVAAIVAAAALLPVAAFAGPEEAELSVAVAGTTAGVGAVRVNLYASAESFLQHKDAQIAADVPRRGAPSLVFKGLKPGTYALVAYYDRNQNGVLDRGVFGVPLEPLGFSNGVVPALSRPDFAEAALVVEEGRQEIEIMLREFGKSRQADS